MVDKARGDTIARSVPDDGAGQNAITLALLAPVAAAQAICWHAWCVFFNFVAAHWLVSYSLARCVEIAQTENECKPRASTTPAAQRDFCHVHRDQEASAPRGDGVTVAADTAQRCGRDENVAREKSSRVCARSELLLARKHRM